MGVTRSVSAIVGVAIAVAESRGSENGNGGDCGHEGRGKARVYEAVASPVESCTYPGRLGRPFAYRSACTEGMASGVLGEEVGSESRLEDESGLGAVVSFGVCENGASRQSHYPSSSSNPSRSRCQSRCPMSPSLTTTLPLALLVVAP